MIYQKQKFLHDPDNGVYGDCHRTAIACILDLPRDDVPHFAEMSWDDADEFHRLVNEWLLNRGLRAVRIPYDCELKDVLNMMEIVNPNIHYLLGGMSRNKVPHSVVCQGGGIIWDPSLDASGIVGSIQDCYWVTFFTPDPGVKARWQAEILREFMPNIMPVSLYLKMSERLKGLTYERN